MLANVYSTTTENNMPKNKEMENGTDIYYPFDSSVVSSLSNDFIVHLFQLKIRVFAS